MYKSYRFLGLRFREESLILNEEQKKSKMSVAKIGL
jgi:hypothetical protein